MKPGVDPISLLLPLQIRSICTSLSPQRRAPRRLEDNDGGACPLNLGWSRPGVIGALVHHEWLELLHEFELADAAQG